MIAPHATDIRRPPSADDVLWLNATEVSALFDHSAAFDSQRAAFQALGSGTASNPDKIVTPNPDGSSLALTYTSQLSATTGPVTKFTAVHPLNRRAGLPTISAVVLALDASTGGLAAVLDGTTITTRRTAAASAFAIETLARDDADVLALFGYGVQAREHVHAIAASRPLREVRVIGPRRSAGESLAAEITADLGIAARAHVDPERAVRGASIIATCTTSRTPLLSAEWLDAGALVLSVGSFEPERHEVGQDVVMLADRVVVDDVVTALAHAGPIMAAVSGGLLSASELTGLGEIAVGARPGRSSPDEIIFYNTTGVGVQDAAAAWSIIERAKARGRVRHVDALSQ
ncbi:ornithine cyclodeaminase family protein [Microbacterium aerolatum]|uniref:ornithine cyclodeaminase family protein n=1 Tax=Microbacterium aerolatum TaxID=153731 RepID=UPI00384FA9AC